MSHHMNANTFEHPENNNQRGFERAGDNIKLIEDGLLTYGLLKAITGDHNSWDAKDQSADILQKAQKALRLNDIPEAAHQLRREVDFCNAVPKLVNSPYEISAKAGLEAIRMNIPAAEVNHVIQESWIKSWANNPTYFDELNR